MEPPERKRREYRSRHGISRAPTGVEDGTLEAVEVLGRGVRYEPKDREHHHHFLCSTCDHAFDLFGCVDGLDSLVPDGFQMTGHEVVLLGTCDACGNAA